MSNLPEKSEIRAAVNRYCQERGLSKADLATRLGISGATLSKIENEKWESIDEKMWLKIWQEVGQPTQAAPVLETANLATVCQMCDQARASKLMVGLLGDTGLGKTTALEYYARRPRVYYVAYDKTMRPKHFFAALLQEMGVAFSGPVHEMVSRAADELNGKGSPLLIIDEAGKLTHQMYLFLHVLRERTKRNCGIVLAGMPYFRANLLKDVNRQKEGAAEFFRRVNVWQELARPTRAEIKAVCGAYGVTEPEAVREMQRHQDFGNLTNALLLARLETENLAYVPAA
jgi:DNA transposition AAA+ family ATPase